MFGLKKSPLKVAKHNSAGPGYPVSSTANPFDYDDELDKKKTLNPSKRTSSEPMLTAPNLSTKLFDDNEGKGASASPSPHVLTSAARNMYKNDFRDSGGIENQSVQELEGYAVYKAEETTKTVHNCVKIAEDMRGDATRTLETLHHQGEQITRTHRVAADIDHDLSRGEKLLGSLGGMFSKTWKPKKNRHIRGPVITRDDSFIRRSSHLERERLGLDPAPKGRLSSRTPPPEPTYALQKVEEEKAKQDDGLSNLSNLLGELKDMAIDMGTEIERHNKALNHLDDDVEELNFRVRGANQRTRRLLGK